jgi:nucleoid DNA-binding protein
MGFSVFVGLENLDNVVMEQRMPDVMSKSELIQKVAEKCSKLTRDEVKQVLDALAEVGQAELRTAGAFLLPGLPSSLSSKSRQPRRMTVSIRSRKRR